MVRIVSLASLVLTLSWVCTSGGFRSQTAPAPTGADWLALPLDERQVFLEGYIDYYVAENLGPIRFAGVLPEYESALSEYLNGHPGTKNQPVERSIVASAPSVPTVARPRGGESHPGKHRFYTTDYWLTLQEARLRVQFISGFLACQQTDLRSKDRYSHGAAWYESKITAEVEKHPGDFTTPIADLLLQFRDK